MAAGSGKSHLLLMHPLQHIRDPNFNGIFFRKVTTQLTGQGGLWEESGKMYADFKVRSRQKPQLTREFPSGAKLQFMHMQHDGDEQSHLGLQYSAVYFDEINQFDEKQVLFMMSRLRSDAEVDSYMMGTTNPDNNSWLMKWVEWYLDEEGFPDKNKQGKIRYFLIIEDAPVFGDTSEELKEKYPDQCRVWNPITGEYVQVEPKTYSFISGTIFDNPALIAKNPKYLADLNAMNRVDRARFLDGNWLVRPEAAGYFKREWLKKVDKAPLGCREYRGWDKASTVPSEENRYPDFTASVKILKDRNGEYYIRGDWIEEARDEKSEQGHRFRRRPGERDTLILKQAKSDGVDCTIVLPVDPGSAGASEYLEASKALISEGFVVQKDPAISSSSKLKRFEPFASACENGLVSIVENSFPNKATLEAFYGELEAFDGTRSTKTRKDDVADAAATAFNAAAKGKTLPKFTLGSTTATTQLSRAMNDIRGLR